MKNIFKLFVCILLVLPHLAVSQEELKPSLHILGQYSEGKIQLRWIPSDHRTVLHMCEVGYSLERITLGDANGDYDFDQQHNSRVTLVENLKPLTSVEWDNKYGADHDVAMLSKKLLYDTSEDVMPSENPSFMDAVNNERLLESKHLFLMLAADRDFEVAQDLAFGFEDETVLPGFEYGYTIRPTDLEADSGTKVGYFAVSTLEIIEYPRASINGYGQTNAVAISWDIENLSKHYSSYDIERSDNGILFEKVNPEPFVYMSSAKEVENQAFYKDSLPNNDDTFYYRVLGRTPFGTLGPASDTIEVKGIPPRLYTQFFIEEHEVSNGNALLKWEYLDDSYTDSIARFDVFTSRSATKNFVKVNDVAIPSDARSYLVQDMADVGYYKLLTTDTNGHEYESFSVLIQLPDTIPPAIPTGLIGEYRTDSDLFLEWEENTDEDLKGYRVFVCNDRNGQYIESTNYPLLTNKFTHFTDPKFAADSVFVKLVAVDNRDNHSEKSEAIGFARPDVIGPAAPVLAKAMPTPTGVELGWEYSKSDDVSLHIVQRKYASSGNWTDILEIPNDEQANYVTQGTGIGNTCYIDTSYGAVRPYDYRIIAIDDNDNKSMSKVVEVKPFSSGVGAEVTGFSLDLEEEEVTANAEYQQAMINLQQAGYDVQAMRGVGGPPKSYDAVLTWRYDLDNTVQDFQILRGISGGPVQVFRTISLAEALGHENGDAEIFGTVGETTLSFKDEELLKGKRYFYQIMARHTTGKTSQRSNTLSKKVPNN